MRTAALTVAAILAVVMCSCGKKGKRAESELSEKMLAGDITESFLSEVRYKRITDGRGASMQGGGEPAHEILKLDAAYYNPLATHWVGIKSLDPIPGMGTDLFFRYKLNAELYADAESAKTREEEFEAVYREHLKEGGSKLSKTFMPAFYFSYGRVFYLATTDMAASLDSNETGKLKFAIIKNLGE